MNGEEFKHDPKAEEWVDPYPKKKSGWRNGLITVVLLLTIYVLSIGPVLLMGAKGMISQAAIDVIYEPLATVSRSLPPVVNFFDWYVHLWFNDSSWVPIRERSSITNHP